MPMKLTVTQCSNNYSKLHNSIFIELIPLDPLKKSLIRNRSHEDNYYDYEDLKDRTKQTTILELTFDKDYEVENEQPSNYYAYVPAWLVRLVSSRSRNRQE